VTYGVAPFATRWMAQGTDTPGLNGRDEGNQAVSVRMSCSLSAWHHADDPMCGANGNACAPRARRRPPASSPASAGGLFRSALKADMVSFLETSPGQPMSLAPDATLADVFGKVTVTRSAFRGALIYLGNALRNMKQLSAVHGEVVVRIGITGDGVDPAYRVDHAASGSLIEAFNGQAGQPLAAHQEEFDRALVDMQNDIPSTLSKFYHPLRLGGVFYGPPPYTDPTYTKGVEDLLSASVIPGAGGFRLFRGRTATGVINGHQVELSLSNAGEIEVQRDGTRVNFDAKGKGDHPGLLRSGWSFYFDADGCPGQQGYCGELIEMIGQRDDLSDWFLIFRQFGPAAWPDAGSLTIPALAYDFEQIVS
jgi:hypothetical protein